MTPGPPPHWHRVRRPLETIRSRKRTKRKRRREEQLEPLLPRGEGSSALHGQSELAGALLPVRQYGCYSRTSSRRVQRSSPIDQPGGGMNSKREFRARLDWAENLPIPDAVFH